MTDLLDGTDAAFSVLANADITVTRSEGSRGADGWTESSTSTELECRGDWQQSGHRLEQMRAHYETGDGLFFAEDSVVGVEAGDSVTIDHDDGRTIEGTVAQVVHDDDSLLISLD